VRIRVHSWLQLQIFPDFMGFLIRFSSSCYFPKA
jgi:hypothetical protein